MTLATVPDHFQEETEKALREQVQWLVHELGVDDRFFARLLHLHEDVFTGWRTAKGSLPHQGTQTLRAFWQTTLHLLSFLNCDEGELRNLLERSVPVRRAGVDSLLTPPWSGSTLRAFLESGGADAISQVDGWVTGLRFGDANAA